MARIKRIYHSDISDTALVDLVKSFNKILQEHPTAYMEQEDYGSGLYIYYTEEMSEQEEAIADLEDKLSTLEREKYYFDWGGNIVKGKQTMLSLDVKIPKDVLDVIDKEDPDGDYYLYDGGRKLVRYFTE